MLEDVDRITKIALDETKQQAVALDTIDFFVPDNDHQECVIKWTDDVKHIPGTFVLNPEEAAEA